MVHKSGKARIATALPMGSRKTLHPSDSRHRASSAKNSDENQVAASQRKAKTKACEQASVISSRKAGHGCVAESFQSAGAIGVNF